MHFRVILFPAFLFVDCFTFTLQLTLLILCFSALNTNIQVKLFKTVEDTNSMWSALCAFYCDSLTFSRIDCFGWILVLCSFFRFSIPTTNRRVKISNAFSKKFPIRNDSSSVRSDPHKALVQNSKSFSHHSPFNLKYVVFYTFICFKYTIAVHVIQTILPIILLLNLGYS